MVKTWLADEDNGPWLLILDNADDATVLLNPSISDTGNGVASVQRRLLGFLPRVQHGAVLITTRDQSCALRLNGYRGTPIEVLEMTLDESVELLRVFLPEADQEEASELVGEVENLPSHRPVRTSRRFGGSLYPNTLPYIAAVTRTGQLFLTRTRKT